MTGTHRTTSKQVSWCLIGQVGRWVGGDWWVGGDGGGDGTHLHLVCCSLIPDTPFPVSLVAPRPPITSKLITWRSLRCYARLDLAALSSFYLFVSVHFRSVPENCRVEFRLLLLLLPDSFPCHVRKAHYLVGFHRLLHHFSCCWVCVSRYVRSFSIYC